MQVTIGATSGCCAETTTEAAPITTNAAMAMAARVWNRSMQTQAARARPSYLGMGCSPVDDGAVLICAVADERRVVVLERAPVSPLAPVSGVRVRHEDFAAGRQPCAEHAAIERVHARAPLRLLEDVGDRSV